MSSKQKTPLTLWLMCWCILAAAMPAKATLLNLNYKTSPDIMAGFISANQAGTVFTASGLALDYDGNPIFESFSILANINASGLLTPAGSTFSIGTLLSGDITAFGFDLLTGPKALDFAFTVTGGSEAAAYGSFGGITLTLGKLTSGTGFPSGFQTDGNGVADVRAVPDAGATGVLMGISLAIVALARQMRVKNRAA